jgi:K+-transporting ATPase ATPase A chain
MPFENPTQFSNFVELLLILCIPVSLTWTYGKMVGSRRQGYAIFAAMSVLFIVGVVITYIAEQHGTPAQHLAGIHNGGNMEGKEVRFGITNSSLWSAVTTVTSCGAVNAGLESLTGIGGLIPFSNLSMSETVFGGVGTGLYSMLILALIAVFIGGLMVGRTPEFLGKKIEAREMKLATLGAIFTPMTALIGAALASGTKWGKPSVFAEGPQGFSESLYAYMSQANNNGSAFAGYTGYYQPTPGNIGAHGITFADLLGGGVMVFARFAPILFVLAIAGSLASKRVAPVGVGTLRTDSPTFVFLLIGVVVLIGALTFFPALLLGPVVQGLTNHLF